MRIRSIVVAAAAVLVGVGVGVGTGAAAPVDPERAVGSRLINGDGDTAGKCLEISGGGNGGLAQMATCHTNAHQSWHFEPVESGWFEIRSHDPDAQGECLTGWSQGTQASMLGCDGARDQQWSRVWAANNWFQLKNRYRPTQCLDVAGHGTTNVVQTFQCGNPANAGPQLWHWHSVG